MNIWLKYALTAFIVVAVSEIAKRSDKLGGLIASLPIMTLLVLFWLHVEKQPVNKIANHAYYTFWYVVGSLPFFLIFPYLVTRIGFGWSLIMSSLATVVFFYGYAIFLRQFGIQLL